MRTIQRKTDGPGQARGNVRRRKDRGARASMHACLYSARTALKSEWEAREGRLGEFNLGYGVQGRKTIGEEWGEGKGSRGQLANEPGCRPEEARVTRGVETQ